MTRLIVVATLAAGAALTGCAALPPELQGVLGAVAGAPAGGAAPLGEADIAAGLREALATGTGRAVRRVGVTDGYWANPAIKIPLPDSLKKVDRALRALGQGRTVDEFHLSLNRAAEQAVPEALPIFTQAIKGMTLADARRILDGPPTAATEYFRGTTQAALAGRFKPIVVRATDSVGATRKYKDLSERIGKYVTSFEAQDLDAYVTERALAGLFRTLGDEEMKIRNDPAARTSELLRKVFGRVP
jgi:hypothetical protein